MRDRCAFTLNTISQQTREFFLIHAVVPCVFYKSVANHERNVILVFVDRLILVFFLVLSSSPILGGEQSRWENNIVFSP